MYVHVESKKSEQLCLKDFFQKFEERWLIKTAILNWDDELVQSAANFSKHFHNKYHHELSAHYENCWTFVCKIHVFLNFHGQPLSFDDSNSSLTSSNSSSIDSDSPDLWASQPDTLNNSPQNLLMPSPSSLKEAYSKNELTELDYVCQILHVSPEESITKHFE